MKDSDWKVILWLKSGPILHWFGQNEGVKSGVLEEKKTHLFSIIYTNF